MSWLYPSQLRLMITKFFFEDQIFKKTKNQKGQPIMSHRDARGFPLI